MNVVTINNKHYNLSAIVKIHDRQVFFNDGKSEIFTEPELQELFVWLFNEPRKEDAKVDSNATVPVRNRTNKPKRVSK